MTSELLVGALALAYVLLLGWSCRTLPGERWQILASLPRSKNRHGEWRGLNLTYYGLFQANAFVVGSALMLLATASMGLSVEQTLLVMLPVMGLAVPSCRWASCNHSKTGPSSAP